MSRGGLSLWLGPDRARKLQRVGELRRSLSIQPLDAHQLDAAATTPAQVLALCRQQPAASPLRFIVIDQAHRLSSICVDALVQQAEVIAGVACVLLLVEAELPPRHPLAQPHPAITTERFPGQPMTPARPFALTDALGRRDAAAAFLAAHEQLVAGKEPLELVGLVAWQLGQWVRVKRLQQAGYDAQRMVSAAGLRSWQVERWLGEVADRSLDSLQRLLARCWQLDVDAKGGRTPPHVALEQLIAEMCLVTQEMVVGAESGGERVGDALGEILDALVTLGYSVLQAREVVKKLNAEGKTSEQLLREALRSIK